MSQLYTTVHFDECGQEHQLTSEEMEAVEVEAGAAATPPDAPAGPLPEEDEG